MNNKLTFMDLICGMAMTLLAASILGSFGRHEVNKRVDILVERIGSQDHKISIDTAREIGADRARLTALEKELADVRADNAAVQDWISDLNDLGYDVGTLPPMVEVKQ